MNTTPFPPGSHLDRLGDVIKRGREQAGDMIDTHVSDTLQASPAVERRNAQNVQFALNAVCAEDMAGILEAYFTARFGKVRASFIGRDIAQKAETRK